MSLLQSVLFVTKGVQSGGVHNGVLYVPVGALFLLQIVLCVPVGGQSMSFSLHVPKP